MMGRRTREKKTIILSWREDGAKGGCIKRRNYKKECSQAPRLQQTNAQWRGTTLRSSSHRVGGSQYIIVILTEAVGGDEAGLMGFVVVVTGCSWWWRPAVVVHFTCQQNLYKIDAFTWFYTVCLIDGMSTDNDWIANSSGMFSSGFLRGQHLLS